MLLDSCIFNNSLPIYSFWFVMFLFGGYLMASEVGFLVDKKL